MIGLLYNGNINQTVGGAHKLFKSHIMSGSGEAMLFCDNNHLSLLSGVPTLQMMNIIPRINYGMGTSSLPMSFSPYLSYRQTYELSTCSIHTYYSSSCVQ